MNDMELPPFWVVWDPEGRSPTFRHLSEISATNEACRLAGQNPGRVFYVLEPISVSERNDVVTKKFTRIPF